MAKTKQDQAEELNYDTAMLELQTIVAELQSDEVGIESLNSLILRANFLKEFCQTRLRTIENEITKNLDSNN
jgi:exodeoxyribonuclease VII small subunit